MTWERIGELRHRLRLEDVSRIADDAGGASESWSAVAEMWAALRPASGDEALEAEKLAGRVTHEVIVRHRAGIRPQMRFVLGSRVFDIRAVMDVEERRRFLRCLVEERQL